MRSLAKLSIFLFALALLPAIAAAQFCGDGSCNSGEESWCTADCFCGNGDCEAGEESWCSADCSVADFCGDGSCDSGEESWCSADCPAQEPEPFCGDGTCNAGEESWCSADCVIGGFCGDGSCDSGEESWCSADCVIEEGPFCGDGNCDSGEESWCSADCFIEEGPFCGDGSCDSGEESWCSADCPAPAPECMSAAWSCTSFSPSVCPSSGIRTRTCTLVDASCLNPGAVKPSETQSCTPPAPANSPPSISFSLPSFAMPSSTVSFTVTAADNDSHKVARIYLIDATGSEIPGKSFNCGGIATCTASFSVTAPGSFDTSYPVRVNATDTAGSVSQLVRTASTARQCFIFSPDQLVDPGTVTHGGLPASVSDECSAGEGKAECQVDGTWKVLQCFAPSPPVCTPAVSCSVLGCGNFDSCGNFCGACSPPPTCTENWQCTDWTDTANSCGTRTCTDLNGCGTTNSKPAESASCPAPGVDNAPSIASFSTPATVDANSAFTVSVTATDDKGVDRIEILNSDGSVAASFQSCSGLLSCTRSFIVQSPNQFNFVFNLIARAFDTASQEAAKTSSDITTNPEPAPEPAPELAPDEVLDGVDISIPSREIFVTTLVPETSCVSPGSETFVYISLRNRGDGELDDVKVTATVQELGIHAVSGPFDVRKGGSASRFIYFIVPDDAEQGEYYIRTTVASQKDSVVKHRVFEVNPAC